jgi:hypothetical protein
MAKLPTRARLISFAQRVAHLTDKSEIAGGMSREDALDTLNTLIAEARRLTGVDPGPASNVMQGNETPMPGPGGRGRYSHVDGF